MLSFFLWMNTVAIPHDIILLNAFFTSQWGPKLGSFFVNVIKTLHGFVTKEVWNCNASECVKNCWRDVVDNLNWFSHVRSFIYRYILYKEIHLIYLYKNVIIFEKNNQINLCTIWNRCNLLLWMGNVAVIFEVCYDIWLKCGGG